MTKQNATATALPQQTEMPMARRRTVLAAALGLIPVVAATGASAAPVDTSAARAEWDHFKARFLRPEGRVVDNMNGNISHSEGQGFAMLLAVRFDDQDAFTRLLGWTRANMTRPSDNLLAWCCRPGEPGGRPGDRNNATDGDLFVAWALAEAADKWNQPNYRALSVAMARDILNLMVVQVAGRAMLLPGIQGFQDQATVTTNPSYYVFPAFQALSRVAPSPLWASLEATGLRLARSARFGRWGLVPDWVAVSRTDASRPGIAPGRPGRFSYDAVRMPLYMAWGGYGAEPLVGAAAQFWHDPSHRQMPAWVDLRTDQTATYAADPGIAHVARVCAISSGQRHLSRATDAACRPDAYYASALRLLARAAMADLPMGQTQIASR